MRMRLPPPYRNIFKIKWQWRILVFITMFVALTIGIRLALGNNVLGVDFYTFWHTAKATFIHHQNPYSDEIVKEIQIGRLNRFSLPGEDQFAFSYPLYMLFLVLPFSFLNLQIAQASWMALFILLLVTVLYLLFSGKPFWPVVSAPFIYPFSFSIILGNYDLLICLILFTFFWAHFSKQIINRSWQVALGVLFTFVVGKPQFSYLAFAFCLLIIVKYKYWRLLFWFLGSLMFFLTASFIIDSAWVRDWITRVQAYSGYNPVSPLYQSIINLIRNQEISNLFILIIFGIMLIALVIFIIDWFRKLTSLQIDLPGNNSSPGNIISKELFILALISVITYAFHPTRLSYDQLIMFIPFFIWASNRLPSHPWIVALFWLPCMILSWVSFYLTIKGIYTQAIFSLPVIFFTVWLVYLWVSTYTSTFKEKSDATP